MIKENIEFLETLCGSKAELARMLGVLPQTINDWLNADNVPTYGRLLIAQFIDSFIPTPLRVTWGDVEAVDPPNGASLLLAAQIRAGQYTGKGRTRLKLFAKFAELEGIKDAN